MEAIRHTIKSDFTTPEVSLEAFAHYQTGESLPQQLANESAAMLAKARLNGVEGVQLAQLELTALNDAVEAVHQSVKYEGSVYPWQAQNSGNCFTFTWLVSDVAENLGFDSRIAFCNGHAFNLIGTPSGQYHLINGETKPMWFFDVLNDSYGNDALPDLGHVFSTTETEYYSMYTKGLEMYTARHCAPSLEIPWVKSDLPAVAVMTPEDGKQALFTYACLGSMLYKGNLRGVHECLAQLESNNPQAETREKINDDLKQFRKNVKRWVKDEDMLTGDIIACIKQYHAIMPDTKSMHVFTADCLRIVGVNRQHAQLLDEADKHYQAALHKTKSRKIDETLNGKIHANKTAMKELERQRKAVITEQEAQAYESAQKYVNAVVDFDDGQGEPVKELFVLFDKNYGPLVDGAIDSMVMLESVGVDDREEEGVTVYELDEIFVERMALYGCGNALVGARYRVISKEAETASPSAVA